MIASFGMYPFDVVASSYDQLWGQLTRQIDWLPDSLTPLDRTQWASETLALSQTCGWPLVTSLLDRVRPVGSFCLDLDSAVGWQQRSHIVGKDPLVHSGLTAAVNDEHSLSGWISLLRYAGVNQWPGEVLWTGSHDESCAAVSEGRADTAAIDSLSMAFMNREGRYLDLQIVGQAPLVPCLPLITSATTSDDQLAELRHTINSIVHDPANAELMSELLITDFVALDNTDYLAAIRP